MVGMITVSQVISFSSDEQPPVGINNNQPLSIMVQYQNFRIPLRLVDNGAVLNVYPLCTTSKLGFKAMDITPATKGMTVFDNKHHDALGILIIPLNIEAVVFDVEIYIVDLEPSFNLLLGHPWLLKHQVIPSTLHCMIKFCWGHDVVVVMAKNFDKERVKAVSSASLQTVQFDPKPFDILYRVNRFEPVNFIPALEHARHLAIHSNPFLMVENLGRRWGYEKGEPLKRYIQGIAEPIIAEERRDFEGLGYNWQPRKDGHMRLKNRKLIVPRDLTNFTNVGILDPNQSQASAQPALLQSPPLPVKKWVYIEDYYSDEEQSDTKTVQTSREVQAYSAVSRSVRLALPSTVITVGSAVTLLELTVPIPYAVSPQFPPTVVVAQEPSALLPASLTSLFIASATSTP